LIVSSQISKLLRQWASLDLLSALIVPLKHHRPLFFILYFCLVLHLHPIVHETYYSYFLQLSFPRAAWSPYSCMALRCLFVVLAVPRYRLNTYGRRAFSAASPTIWNSLPDFIRDSIFSAECFRRLLKTYLFARYWCIQRVRGPWRLLRYINRLTYLLNYWLCSAVSTYS